MKRIETLAISTLEPKQIVQEILTGFHEISFSEKRILIVCEDNTRETPLPEFLPELLYFLLKKTPNITILIANGTHKSMTSEEIIDKLGVDATKMGIIVLNHEPESEEKLVSIGNLKDGPEVRLNSLVAQNDILIGIGSTLPHRVAGFSGGAKILLPGIADKETVAYTHWKSNQFSESEIVGKPNNPVREMIDQTPGLLEQRFGLLCLSINCVLLDTKVASVFVGGFHETYRQSAELAKNLFIQEVEPSHAILARVPKKCVDFWQAAKAVYNCARTIEDGGIIVVAGEMPNGIAPEHPQVESFGYPSVKEIEQLVNEGKITDLLGASHMIRVCQSRDRVNIVLSSPSISEEECSRLHLGYLSPDKIDENAFDYVIYNPVDVLLALR